jgi:hypothetical protein
VWTDPRDATRGIKPTARGEATIEQKDGLLGQFSNIEVLMAIQPVIGRHHGQSMHGKERPLLEALIRQRERQVHIATLEAISDAEASLLDKVDLNTRMSKPIVRQEWRKGGLDHLRCGCDTQQSCLSLFEHFGFDSE